MNKKSLKFINSDNFRALAENAFDSIFVINGKMGKIVYANNAGLKMVGYKKSELVNKQFKFLLKPDEFKEVFDKYKKRQGGQKIPSKYEINILRKDKKNILAEISVALTTWEGQIASIAILRDISDRKKAEVELQKSEEKFRKFFEHEPYYCYMVSPVGKIIGINKSALRVLGRKRDELLNKSFLTAVYTKSSQEKAKKLFQKWKKTGQLKNEELKIKAKNGEERDVLLNVNCIKNDDGNIVHSLSVQIDITEKKRQEEILKNSEIEYKDTLDSMGDAIHVVDRNLRIILINNCFKKINKQLGFSSVVIGKKLSEVFPFLTKKVYNEYQQVIKTGQVLITEETNKFNNKKIITETRKIPIIKNNQVVKVMTIIKDIGGQKQTELALKESEEKFRALVETTSDWIWEIDKMGKYVYSSPKIKDILGYDAKEMIGRTPFDFMSEKEANRTQKIFGRLLKKCEPLLSLENTNIHKDGREVILETSGIPIFDDQGEFVGYRGVDRDVTERKKSESMLIKKLELQNLTSTISSRFLGNFDINKAINISLMNIGKSRKVSHAYLFLFRNKNIMDNTHEWCAKGARSEINNLQNLPIDIFSWSMKKINNKETVYIKNVEEMPSEAKSEKEFFQSKKIKSLIFTPLFIKGRAAGFIGFDDVKSIRYWGYEDFLVLRLCSEVFSRAFERKYDEDKIKESLLKLQKSKRDWKTTADTLPHIVCLVNKKGVIVRANKVNEAWGLKKFSRAKKIDIPNFLYPKSIGSKYKFKELWEENWQKAKQGRRVEFEFDDKILDSIFNIQINLITKTQEKDSSNFAVVVVHDITERVKAQRKVFELYKHLGMINRRLAILLSLNQDKRDSKEKIFKFITKSAKNSAQAKVCLLYKYNRRVRKFSLLSSSGNIKQKIQLDIKEFSYNALPFFKSIISDKKRVQGINGEMNLGSLNIENKINSFTAFPLTNKKGVIGVLFLGFSKDSGIGTQELEFYDLFAVHTSHVLEKFI